MKALFVSFLALTTGITKGNTFDITEVSIEADDYRKSSRDPLLKDLKGRFGLNLGVRAYKKIKWNNSVWGLTNDKRFKTVSWDFFLGYEVSPEVDIGWAHRSSHLLDDSWPWRYPLRDSLRIKIWLIK